MSFNPIYTTRIPPRTIPPLTSSSRITSSTIFQLPPWQTSTSNSTTMTSTSPILLTDDDDGDSSSAGARLDLSSLPPIFILPTKLRDVTLHSLEQSLLQHRAPLTYNLHEAGVVLADVNTARRAEAELRGRGLWTQKVEGQEGEERGQGEPAKGNGGVVKMVKVRWLTESVESGKDMGMERYVVYTARKIPRPPPSPEIGGVDAGDTDGAAHKKPKLELLDDVHAPTTKSPSPAAGILERAKLDAKERSSSSRRYGHATGMGHSRFGRNHRSRNSGDVTEITHQPPPPSSIPHLQHVSTDEWESTQSLLPLRPPPEYVTKHLKYSCQRSTPLTTPNDHFLSLLQTIKLSRILSLDPIGIRAYSTAIASIAAYPYPLLSSAELSLLPGCDGKTSSLFHEYIHSTPTPPTHPDPQRTLGVVSALEANSEFQTLKLFWGIWGVGAITAREFYFEKGWRSLDDVVEYGWGGLSRVQQIGVKYYREFNEGRLSRAEVERIAGLIIAAARAVGGDDAWEGLVCGGYRRGKESSGDVDIVLSHPEEALFEGHPGGKGGAAVDWVGKIVGELEKGGWVTHTLYLGRGGGFGSQKAHIGDSAAGSGGASGNVLHDKDVLSKAMVVWQEQEQEPQGTDGGTNPAPHRRVDIILAPPSSAASAVLGWTGAATFERDLRRFVEEKHAWKFDSGGVWDRRTGERVRDLGGWRGSGRGREGEGEGLVEAERRLLGELGVGWVEPGLRNTG